NRKRHELTYSQQPELGTREQRKQHDGHDTSQKSTNQARDYIHQAKDRHAYHLTLIAITQICRYPEAQSARYESHQCHRDAVDEIGTSAEQIQVVTDAPAR